MKVTVVGLSGREFDQNLLGFRDLKSGVHVDNYDKVQLVKETGELCTNHRSVREAAQRKV